MKTAKHLDAHQIKVARALLVDLFDITTRRTNREGDTYVWATIDGTPHGALKVAERKGWTRKVTGTSSFRLYHSTWPGAVLEVCWNELGKRPVQVAVMKEVVQ